jgi:hypothetical protein
MKRAEQTLGTGFSMMVLVSIVIMAVTYILKEHHPPGELKQVQFTLLKNSIKAE